MIQAFERAKTAHVLDGAAGHCDRLLVSNGHMQLDREQNAATEQLIASVTVRS
jgi:hypothetical protein